MSSQSCSTRLRLANSRSRCASRSKRDPTMWIPIWSRSRARRRRNSVCKTKSPKSNSRPSSARNSCAGTTSTEPASRTTPVAPTHWPVRMLSSTMRSRGSWIASSRSASPLPNTTATRPSIRTMASYVASPSRNRNSPTSVERTCPYFVSKPNCSSVNFGNSAGSSLSSKAGSALPAARDALFVSGPPMRQHQFIMKVSAPQVNDPVNILSAF